MGYVIVGIFPQTSSMIPNSGPKTSRSYRVDARDPWTRMSTISHSMQNPESISSQRMCVSVLYHCVTNHLKMSELKTKCILSHNSVCWLVAPLLCMVSARVQDGCSHLGTWMGWSIPEGSLTGPPVNGSWPGAQFGLPTKTPTCRLHM